MLGYRNPRTTDRVTPTGRRANVVNNDNLLRSWRSSEGDAGEREGQESDEGQTGHCGGRRRNEVCHTGVTLCHSSTASGGRLPEGSSTGT